MVMVYLILVGIGLCLGSFVNALVWRVHDQAELAAKAKLSTAEKKRLKALSLSKGRSMCLSCGHELSAKDLVPVLSWLGLKGRCRYCGARIPDTPLAELLVPLLFVVSYAFWPYVLQGFAAWAYFVLWLLAVVAFVALALYDTRWFLLPDRIVFPLTALAAGAVACRLAMLGNVSSGLLGAGIGVLIVAGLFYGLFAVSDGGWIGGGDVKLGVALGLLAGGFLEGLFVILLASIFGLLAALPQLIRHRMTKTAKIPFGPFLLLATFVVVLFGARLIDWYTDLLVL